MKNWGRWAVLAAVLLLVGTLGAELIRGSAKKEPFTFSGTDLQGKTWSFAEHRGRHPVIVSFFATWCGPCRMEMPHLLEMQKEFGDRGVQLVLLTDEDAATVRQVGLDRIPAPILTESGPVFKAYNVNGIPRTLFFTEKGELLHDLEGFDEQGLQKIRDYLAKLPVATARN